MASSYNELFGLGSHSEDADLEGWWPLQDDAASTVVVDESSNADNGLLVGGNNTEDLAVAGPNSWLGSALNFDGSSDYINQGSVFEPGTGNYTLLARAKTASTFGLKNIFRRDPGNAPGRTIIILRFDSQAIRFYQSGSSGGNSDSSHNGAYADNDWHNFAGVRASSGSSIFADGAFVSSVGNTGDLTNSAHWLNGANVGSGGTPNELWPGSLADISMFSRDLSLSELQEWEDGPEPANTIAPTLSGTAQEGQTLTATSGTWGLDSPFSSGSNGTITYSYSWYRADDASGTNRTAITGETGATYTLTSSDVGKYVQVQVRAQNDGGYDSDADTASTYTTAVTSSGGGGGGFNSFYASKSTVVIANA